MRRFFFSAFNPGRVTFFDEVNNLAADTAVQIFGPKLPMDYKQYLPVIR